MQKVIDVAAIGKNLDVPVVASYGPNHEGPFYNQVWSKEYVLQMLERIEPDKNGDTYVLTGHVDPWIFVALIKKLEAKEIVFRVPAGDERLFPMTRGIFPYEGVCHIREDGDDVFVTVDFDKLERTVGGPMNIDMDALALPEIPQGKNVYFHGIGKFPFQMRIAVTLMEGCKSLSCASGAAEVYCCSIPGGPMKEIGDTRPIK